MKVSEFIRYLKQNGVRVENGKRHYKLYLNGKQSTAPRHLGSEINERLRLEICKQLGL